MFYTLIDNKYLLTVEPVEKFKPCDEEVFDENMALYKAEKIKIINIETLEGEKIKNAEHLNIDEIYDYYTLFKKEKKKQEENVCKCFFNNNFIYICKNKKLTIEDKLFKYNFETHSYPPNTMRKSYHSNGRLRYEGYYNENGKEDGLHFMYNEDGNPETEINYKNGNYDGLYKSFFNDGGICEETIYRNNKIVEQKKYYKNNKIFIEKTKDYLLQYYEDGMLYYSYDTNNRIGTTYLKNGNIITQKKLKKNHKEVEEEIIDNTNDYYEIIMTTVPENEKYYMTKAEYKKYEEEYNKITEYKLEDSYIVDEYIFDEDEIMEISN
jgi:antitoxin component YwqK of YwqJK toxin-antitoxin module